MSEFAIRLETLADVLDRLARFETELVDQLAELDSRVSRLHATWSGSAADEHRAAHERWCRGAGTMREAVAELRRAGASAHGNYGSAVAANQRMWV